VRAVVCCVTAVRLTLIARVHGSIGVNSSTVAVVLETLGAVGAVFLQTAACLSADADARALLDVLDVLADLDSFADDFVADDAG
jgi:hypothetical protein